MQTWTDEARQMIEETGLTDLQISRATGLTDKFVFRVRSNPDYEPGSEKLFRLYSWLWAHTRSVPPRSAKHG